METSAETRLRDLEKENSRLQQELAECRREQIAARSSRLAALNLMEDAVESRRRAEGLNDELRTENAERKRAEQSLKGSEERLRTLFDSMSEAFAVKEPLFDASGKVIDYRFVESNAAFPHHTGLGDPRGKTVRELLPGIGPEWMDFCGDVLSTGRPARMEAYLAPIGRWLNISASRLEGADTPRLAIVFADVTESRHTQEALRASEERLRTMADAVPQIIWTNDAEGHADYFNKRWSEYSGLAPEEAHGAGWQNIVHPEDAVESAEAWGESLRAGETFDREFRLRRADGEYRWFIARNLPLRDADGVVTGWFGSATDIHDLKMADASIRESEELLRRAIEEAPIPVIMQAEDGQVLKISRTWTELTGYTLAEIPTFEAWVDRAYGPGAERVRDHMHHLFTGNERTLDVELDVVTRSGETRRWAFSASAPGTLHDTRRFIVGMALDITERTRAENALRENQERLQLIVENAREYAIFSMDLQRRVTSWNSGAEAILGYAQAEILGQPADLIFTSEDRLAGVCEHEARTAMIQGRASDERWHVRKDQSVFWASGVMTAMHDAAGEIVGLVKIFRDQTETRAAQRALEESRGELMAALRENEKARAEIEAASRAKDRFLAILSHELRTPLTPVLMMTMAMQKRKDLDPSLERALEMIRRNVKLECHLIDDLLDLTRIAHGKLEILRETLDAHDAIRRAIEVTLPDLERRKQKFALSLTASRATLPGDAVRLQQLIWNLIKNASKFSPEGSEIRIATCNEEDNFIVTVSDNGGGIPPDKLAVIFDPFTQADIATFSEHGGLGLGLAIAKATAEAHGGNIQAHSDGAGHGAVFTVSLPLPRSEPSPVREPIGGPTH